MDWEEGHSRKEQKRDRKMAQRTDRSQYKKSDLDKKEPPALPTHLPRARVIRIRSQEVDLLLEDGRALIGVMRGLMKHHTSFDKRLLAVGDWVRVQIQSSPENQKEAAAPFALIEAIEPRKSVLQRAEHFQRRQRQTVAANIDQVAVIMSVGLPALKPALIDRFLIAAAKGGMKPLIVFTKSDLLPNFPDQAALLQTLRKIYEALEVPVFVVSTQSAEGVEPLARALAGSSTVFSGQSGVGKSSLVNALIGSELPVAEVIQSTRKGSHTTTAAQLLPIKEGGWLVDTPGLRSFGVWSLDAAEVQHYFPEIQQASAGCRFHNCSHDHEPGCAIPDAVQAGLIHPLRLESYHSLRRGEGLRDILDWLEA